MVSSQASEGSPLFILSSIISHLEELGYPEKGLKSIKKCGNPTGVSYFISCGCGTKELDAKHHCNNRSCPPCAKYRRNRILNQYLPVLKKIKNNPRAKTNLKFLTISPENFDSEKGIAEIRKHFAKFIRLKYIKERLKGGLLIVETRTKNRHGEDKGWNIHLHAIIYSAKLDNKVRVKGEDSKLVKLWKKSSETNAHIYINSINNYKGSLVYVSKYISSNKDDFFTLDHLARYVKATYKKRLINTFGIFFGKKLRDFLPSLFDKNGKWIKNVSMCHICLEKLIITFDFEAMEIVREKRHKPPELIWPLK